MVAHPQFSFPSRRRSEVRLEGRAWGRAQALLRIIWVNDGVDGYCTVAGETMVQDALDPSASGNTPNYQQNKVTCTRDLENFARLWVDLAAMAPFLNSTTNPITVGLEWHSATGSPAINLYMAAPAAGSPVVTGGADYLTDSNSATIQATGTYSTPAGTTASYGASLGTVSSSTPYYFPSGTFNGLTQASPNAHLLFEGVSRGGGCLTLTFYTGTPGNYTKIGEGPGLWLDLKDIKEMYERWTVGDGPTGGGGPPSTTATISAARVPGNIPGLTYNFPLQPTEQNSYILFVHGWNMEGWEKDAFAESAFKRLYWQGYRGRFGTFQWPTTYGGTFDSVVHGIYNQGEHSAWQSATPLANLLTVLSGSYSSSNLYVLAHSMGNVVTGEALRLLAQGGSTNVVNTYVGTQAAVPGEAWDSTLATNTNSTLVFPPGTGPDTPDIYPNWLSAPGSAVATKASFYNTTDYALGYWQTDQTLKPNWFGVVPNITAYYYASFDLSVVAEEFKTGLALDPITALGIVTGHTALVHTALVLGDETNATTTNRYDILAYDAEPRSLALGAIAVTVAGFSGTNLGSSPSGSTNPSTIWPTDTLSGNTYNSHPWHSAEFRFDNMSQRKYWKTLLGPNGFNLTSP